MCLRVWVFKKSKWRENKIAGIGKAKRLILIKLTCFLQGVTGFITQAYSVDGTRGESACSDHVLLIGFQQPLVGWAYHWETESFTLETRQRPLWMYLPYIIGVSHSIGRVQLLRCQLTGGFFRVMHRQNLEESEDRHWFLWTTLSSSQLAPSPS